MDLKIVLIISCVLFAISFIINIFAYILEKVVDKKKKNVINFKNNEN